MKNLKECLISENQDNYITYYVEFSENWIKVKDDKKQDIFNKSFRSFDDCIKEIEQHAESNNTKAKIIMIQK